MKIFPFVTQVSSYRVCGPIQGEVKNKLHKTKTRRSERPPKLRENRRPRSLHYLSLCSVSPCLWFVRVHSKIENDGACCLSNTFCYPIHSEVKNKTSPNENENLIGKVFTRSSRVRGPFAPHHGAPTIRRPASQETASDATRPLTSSAQIRTARQCSERSDLTLRRLPRLGARTVPVVWRTVEFHPSVFQVTKRVDLYLMKTEINV